MNSQLTITVDYWKEDGGYVAHCPSLELASQGSTLEEAEKNFHEALEGFYESCKSRGVLEDALLECGWVKVNGSISPPQRVRIDQINIPETV